MTWYWNVWIPTKPDHVGWMVHRMVHRMEHWTTG
jgi:hypothetical protein